MKFPQTALLCVRPLARTPTWAGRGRVMKAFGMNDAAIWAFIIANRHWAWGPAMRALYTRFGSKSYAVKCGTLDPDMF